MNIRYITLCTYDSDTEKFSQTNDLFIQRQTFSKDTPRESEHTFAVRPSKKFRIEVASKSGDIFHNTRTHQYHIWFDADSFNKNTAIEAISNYILDVVTPKIKDLNTQLEKNMQLADAASRLLENVDK